MLFSNLLLHTAQELELVTIILLLCSIHSAYTEVVDEDFLLSFFNIPLMPH